MLGYVRCDEGEMLVKHQRLYGAAYCGLCHSIRKNKMKALLPFFSYDFVFLSLVRLLVTGEEMSLEKDFCLLHPFRKKKMRLKDNRALSYSAFAAALLTAEKMEDDLLDGDSPFFRRLVFRLYLPFLRCAIRSREKKDSSLKGLSQKIREILKEGRALEKSGADLDAMSSNFGACLGELMAWGTMETEHRLLFGVGEFLGKYIYTLDALEDAEKDLATGAFNPLIANGALPDDKALFRLDQVQAFLVGEMKKILDLTEGDEALFCICENIICRGLPAQMKKLLKPEEREKK